MVNIEYPLKKWLKIVYKTQRGTGGEGELGYMILMTILSHPDEMPTFQEVYTVFEGRVKQKYVKKKMQALIKAGIITPVENNNMTFYAFTPKGFQFASDLGFLEERNKWKNIYQLQDKSKTAIKHHQIERPEKPTSNYNYKRRDVSGLVKKKLLEIKRQDDFRVA